jgi:hypothetical protein
MDSCSYLLKPGFVLNRHKLIPAQHATRYNSLKIPLCHMFESSPPYETHTWLCQHLGSQLSRLVIGSHSRRLPDQAC